MRLILTLAGGGSSIPEKDKIRTLSSGTITIGRAVGNEWVLPDPDRNLSKTHCTVTEESGRFILTDLSSNGVFVNGSQQATERNSRVILTDGDTLRLGAYTISVAVIDDVSTSFSVRGSLSSQDDAGLHGDRFASNGFGDAGRSLDYSAADPLGIPPGHGAGQGGPLDVDPLDDPLGRVPDPAFHHPVTPAPAQPRGMDPFDQAGPSQHRSIDPDDDLFRGLKTTSEWHGASRPDNAPATDHAMPAIRVTQTFPAGEIDFDALIGDIAGHAAPAPAAFTPSSFAPAPAPAPVVLAPAASVPPEPEIYVPAPPAPVTPVTATPPAVVAPPVAEPDPFFEPPKVSRPEGGVLEPVLFEGGGPTAAAEPSPTPPPSSVAPLPPTNEAALGSTPPPPEGTATTASDRGGDARAALMAFLEGAGVSGARIDNDDPEAALRAAGKVFRALTEGVREVLISRASIKSEMRLEQTMIAAHGNNPLKFAVTADDAVAALLISKRPGYMTPLAATQEALTDIKTHEIAVMAGVQTALLALLRRFDPDELEKRLTMSALSAVLPGARKSRYWDGFRQTYGDITREAEDDFQAVFGRPFARAYAAQSRKE
jgi:type VI secretion system protein